jgi:hypothetical protein
MGRLVGRIIPNAKARPLIPHPPSSPESALYHGMPFYLLKI